MISSPLHSGDNSNDRGPLSAWPREPGEKLHCRGPSDVGWLIQARSSVRSSVRPLRLDLFEKLVPSALWLKVLVHHAARTAYHKDHLAKALRRRVTALSRSHLR